MRKRLVVSFVLLAPVSVRAYTQLLVPAYFDPSSSTDWSTLAASVSATVPITVIMNPDSGPVATVDSSYTSAIANVQAAGGKVIAYVHTTDGSRSLSDVENDVATYKSEYPNINGIFIDEMAISTSELSSYYAPLYAYIKTENSSWEVIGNPGTNTIQFYLSPTPAAADVLVTFENSSGYSAYTPASWESSFSPASFANIAYNQSSATIMQNDLSLAAIDHAESVYISNKSGSNPYSALPKYWSQEVAAVSAINSAPNSTYVAPGSGDYNVAANWSAAIPNAIDAEADFLGAISSNHTVYSDTAITVGKIVFDNSNSYVLAGAGSLTLKTSVGSATVDAQAGTQKITLPITVASNTVFNADSGATLVIAAPVTVDSGQTLSESGAGHVTILGAVTVQSGGSAALIAGASIQSLILTAGADANVVAATPDIKLASQVDTLSVSPGSLLDLQNTDLIVHNGDLSTITGQIKSGLGMIDGIGSSASSSDSTHLTTLGVISNDGGGLSIYSSFDGTAVTSSDVLIKYTDVGDANLDGVVDASDYSQINAGFSGGLTGWYNGDFNYDGVVNGSDYTLIDNSFNSHNQTNPADISAKSTAEVSSAVPEPSSLIWVGLSTISLFRRCRRKQTSL